MEPEVDTSKSHSRLWTLVVDKSLPLLTALLGVITAAIGVWGVRVNDDNNQLNDAVAVAESDIEGLRHENEALREEIEELTDAQDGGAGASESPTVTTSGTSTTEREPSSEEPGITVSPDEAPAGEPLTITVSGSGFEPNETVRIGIGPIEVEVCADGASMCTALRDLDLGPTGAFDNVQIGVSGTPVALAETTYVVVRGNTSREWASEVLRLT